MAQAALYRRYRSKSFADVVGQDHVTQLLTEAVKSGAISHAYLFTGPRGVGKTSVARILAHEINGLPYSETPHIDIIEIDAASNRRIDDIRDLREKVHIAPVNAMYKVYIIDEVHMLTGESFNALLKTLEEPPAHVVFILATTEIQKVPATIISRTQRFHFRPGSRDSVVAHLKSIAAKEKIDIDEDALKVIARHGEGSFRDSVGLLDQISSVASGRTITAEDVSSLLGLASQQAIEELRESIRSRNLEGVISRLRALQQSGAASSVIADQLTHTIVETATHREDFELIERLLEVAKSPSPDLKLIAVIAQSCTDTAPAHTPKPQTKAESIAPPAPIAIAPAPEPAIAKVEAPKPEPQPITSKPIEQPAPTRTGSGKFDWEAAMAQLAKRHPPLYSVLKRADVSYDGTRLTLEFAYLLHQKKLEDSKYRGLLMSLLSDMFGECPEVVIQKRTPKPPKNELAAEVAGIMGGGEEVNAT